MANNTFTKTIGSTERALKALLDRVLGSFRMVDDAGPVEQGRVEGR